MRPRRSPSAHLRSCSWIPSWRRSRRARSWYQGNWQTSSMFLLLTKPPKKSTFSQPFFDVFPLCLLLFVVVRLIPRTPWPRWSSASKPAAWNPENHGSKSVDSSESVPWFSQRWHKSHRLGLALSSGPAIKHCFYTTSAVLPLAFVVRYKSCPIGGQPSRKPWPAMTSWVTNL